MTGEPANPYTAALLKAFVTVEQGRMYAIPGVVPTLSGPLAECPFAARCPLVGPECRGGGAGAAPARRSRGRMREGVNEPILEVGGLVKDYVTRDAKLQQRVTRAVDGIDFEVRPGETFAIVGESGSGKSTVGRVLLKLTEATGGRRTCSARRSWSWRRNGSGACAGTSRWWFQDPLAAFDPRASIRSSLREFAEFGGGRSRAELDLAVDEAVRDVGLPPEIADRRPAAVSGGQQLQRA